MRGKEMKTRETNEKDERGLYGGGYSLGGFRITNRAGTAQPMSLAVEWYEEGSNS